MVPVLMGLALLIVMLPSFQSYARTNENLHINAGVLHRSSSAMRLMAQGKETVESEAQADPEDACDGAVADGRIGGCRKLIEADDLSEERISSAPQVPPRQFAKRKLRREKAAAWSRFLADLL